MYGWEASFYFEGYDIGYRQGLQFAYICNLMGTTGWSMEETMRKLEIPEEEWDEYKKMMREEILKI